MNRFSGGYVRRSLTVSCLLLMLSTTACGGTSTGGDADDDVTDSSTPSASSTAASSASPGEGADKKCGDGSLKTRVVEASRGVRLTAPADWQAKAYKGGSAIGLYPPDRDVGDGYLVVQPADQTLDEAVDYALQATVKAARKTSEQDLDLPGFDAGRMVTFDYDDAGGGTFLIAVVAVSDGLRVVANMTREGVPEEQPVAESCLSTLRIEKP